MNNILYLPNTIDPANLDDKKAYFINYLYTYPFTFKHRVKSQVLSQKSKFMNIETQRLNDLRDSDIRTDSYSKVGLNIKSKGISSWTGCYSNVVTSDDYYDAWNGFIPVYSQKMRKIITTKDYGRVRDQLLDDGIIDCDWSYSNFESNRYPMHYSLSESNRFSPPSCYRLTNVRFDKKLNDMNRDRYNSYSPLLKVLQDKLFQIDFDTTSASNFISTQNYSNAAFDSRMKGIQIMNDKSPLHYSLHESPVAKRVFSPVTSLARDLRPFMSYNNQSFWDVDVSSALPTLFNLYLKDLNNEDVKLYRFLTGENDENIDIYKYLGLLWDEDDRDIVKVLTMVLFFGKESNIKHLRKKFKNEFPTVSKIMGQLKKDDHKYLARTLMQLERKLMIDTTVSDLLNDDPNIMVLTIHDGILTTEEQTMRVKNNIENSIKDVIGFKPKVKIKQLKK